MERSRLLGLALALILALVLVGILGAYAAEPLHADHADDEPVGSQEDPISALNEPLAPSAFRSPTGDWHIECVDCPKQFSSMTDRCLQLDRDDHPHIAYGGEHLYYAWYDGVEWHYETVDSASGVGQSASLALDVMDHPRISYYDSSNADLKYAYWTGSTWDIQVVDSAGDVGGHTSLALDLAGNPHISYYDWANHDLEYAFLDATGWHTQTVDSYGWAGSFASLAMDQLGNPHISYAYSGHQGKEGSTLRYAFLDITGWHTQTVVDTSVSMGRYTSLALDTAGHPHISFHNDSYDDLVYARWTGSAWDVQTVDSEGSVGWATSLALDATGHPHIGYMDHTGLGLKYARWTGSTWDIQTVGGTGFVGWAPSLALDAAGDPHISYHDVWNADLGLARWTGSAWDLKVVDSGGSVGIYTSLALDAAGHPHISYHRESLNGLEYAYWTGSTWDIQTVEGEGWRGSHTSLALDEADNPHISYYNSSDDALEYAHWTGSTWDIATVDNQGDVGDHTSLALDDAGNPHISYRARWPDFDLRYAFLDATGWHIQTVDHQGDVGQYASLALDEAGNPYISYYGDGDLKYAHWTGSTWDIQAVDGEGGRYTSLALDAADHPHISYYGDGDLKYAHWTGSTWDIQAVDGEGGRYTSLALDAADHPHISYYSDGILKYAHWMGSDWDIQTVDGDGDVGLWTSLALDAAGSPHISYRDNTNGDLKYARPRVPPLALHKEGAPRDGLCFGDALTYTLTITGPGLSVRLVDPLPDNVDYVSGSITGTITPTAVYSPTAHAVVWQGTLSTGTVDSIHFQVTPEITFVRSLAAPQEVTNTGWLTDTEYGRAITATASTTLMPIPVSLDVEAVPRDGLRQNDLLTYTLTMSGAGLKVLLWDPLPPMVRYVPGSIAGTLVPTPIYSPTAHAIVWEGTLPTDTVEAIRFQVTPGITGTGSLDLSRPIVNTAWLTATESGREVRASVIVNGHQIYVPFVLRESSV